MNTQNKVNQILLVRNLACLWFLAVVGLRFMIQKQGKDLAEEEGIRDMRI